MDWISVKTKLPEYGEDCLVWCVFRAAMEHNVAFLSDEEGWITTEAEWNIDHAVTHWMPLPEPPEEPEKDELA